MTKLELKEKAKAAIAARYELRGVGGGYEQDCVLEFYLKNIESGEFHDLPVALIGLDLWNQKGAFYVFLPFARNAQKIPVRSVLRRTNSAGSVMVCVDLLTKRIRDLVFAQMVHAKLDQFA